MLQNFGEAAQLESVFPLQSLDKPIRCALIALDTLHRGERTPDCIHQSISDTIDLVKKEKQTPDISISKPPFIVFDLFKILSYIPDCFPEKPFEASLFLLSLCTGARASTCAAIELRDIERIVCLKDTSVLLITIRLRKMKGHHAQDTVVTLEGDVFTYSCLNAVFWLQEHLTRNFSLSLTSLMHRVTSHPAAKNNIPDIQLEKVGLVTHSARIWAKKAKAHNRDVGVRGRPPELNCSQQT
ncbi:hypothetical protein BLNAU_13327 [Blattamonas nauphoetae]|uniref:Tyr recombinase domain-containing protein n=1 Tax=Blattamonas nauphoetae TaxID=2049346 RepID=A0ABQ9XNK3_9EUKA|nr:hypothetical protein BLNAU_13327 [Blattamonas nauphoetae]